MPPSAYFQHQNRRPGPRGLTIAIALAFGVGPSTEPSYAAGPDSLIASRAIRADRGVRFRDQISKAQQGTIVVENCDDSGPGSLRSALDSAVDGDAIDLTQLVCSTITLESALDVSVGDLVILGPGSGSLSLPSNAKIG